MKKVLAVSIFTLSFMFGAMMMPKQVKAECQPGAYVSRTYLVWDKDYSCNDRGNTGHYIVNLNSGYLNVRRTPSTNGEIIGKLYNGARISTDATACFQPGCYVPGWVKVKTPYFY
ncbi:hypothetical protein NZ45_16340 [Clostridium botulinum]|uniref:SH3 domain-containing protein n=1 Tax=Clostridium botulinum TaxID=1491 RepID=A0ABD7CKW9_CLOBO|nr:SH3 domain-containing protein [Clostridium botulinum]KGO12708.1 hypothetical protein NZ45_16340 [Clostridium botulinum]QRI54070.1 SH3 domain-containing protein [Clostridium botulinum]